MNIDVERLRRDLMDYYGTALGTNPMAVIELSEVERASEEELIEIAENNGINIKKYIEDLER